jgi:hypothetical protein
MHSWSLTGPEGQGAQEVGILAVCGSGAENGLTAQGVEILGVHVYHTELVSSVA